ncbi:MAG TPA: RluA family pseudouridine synthase [Leucothrix sp.]|nr:RluA family pseudouridine synthase [Leucothrix sp.]
MKQEEKNLQRDNKNIKRYDVRFVTVTADHAGQRIDNFLLRELKDVPRSYVYRILRKGEVRVNKKRIKQTYKLVDEDIVRIPPVFLPEKSDPTKAPDALLLKIKQAIIFEDDDLIFINKPSGMAVHGGSGIRYGLIESFRQLRPALTFIELVHRLDKETSGIVMLAKNRQTLLALHDLLKTKSQDQCIHKYYQTLVKGQWQGGTQKITNTLQRRQGKQQKVRVLDSEQKQAGEQGKEAVSLFTPLKTYAGYTLLKVELLTGRMHQIRTQLADMGHPILGDSQYGDFALNRELKKTLGVKRLFLHAYQLQFSLHNTTKQEQQREDYNCEILLADDLIKILEKIKV